MTLSVKKGDDGSETFDLTQLSLFNLRDIHTGLLLLLERNPQNTPAKVLASSIYAGALCERADTINEKVDPKTIMAKNKATLKALGAMVPMAVNPNPVPQSLKGLTYGYPSNPGQSSSSFARV